MPNVSVEAQEGAAGKVVSVRAIDTELQILSQSTLCTEELKGILPNHGTSVASQINDSSIMQREALSKGNLDASPLTDEFRWNYAIEYSAENRKPIDEIYLRAFFNGIQADATLGSDADADAKPHSLLGLIPMRDTVLVRITEGTASLGSKGIPAEACQVTVTLEQELLARLDFPLVAIKGYTITQVRSGAKVSHLFFQGASGEYLTASAAAKIPNRLLILPNLVVTECHSVNSAIQLRRNANLSHALSFSNPFIPLQVSAKRINLAASSSDGNSVKRTMERHLQTLYSTLFLKHLAEGLQVEVSVNYAYTVAGLELVMPVLHQPLRQMKSNDKSISKMAATLSKGCNEWHVNNLPPSTGAEWQFAVKVCNSEQVPIFELRRLYLKAVDMK
ncbi:MAG: hypothetical protein JKX92_06965 [Porticoccaceae bacterium]|nr:hypothetical protein [Porticoccaceae bacterium]